MLDIRSTYTLRTPKERKFFPRKEMWLEITNVWTERSDHEVVLELHQEGTHHADARKTLQTRTCFRQYILDTTVDLGIAGTAFSFYCPSLSTLVNSCL